MDLNPGMRIDRYLLVKPLGEGGQGAVWQVDDPLPPGQPKALKLVAVTKTQPNDRERIRREAHALSDLEHPSLVKCHGLFEDFKHQVFGISMDYVDGPSLKRSRTDARMTEELAGHVLRHVANALAYLHDNGVVHRDLKLDNVVVAEGFWKNPQDPTQVKLVDFGIAAPAGNPQPLTVTGGVIGTVAYMAPELIDSTYFEGSASAPAIDIFAFGVMGCELLIGRHPTGLSAASGVVDYATLYRSAAQGRLPWPVHAPEGRLGEILCECLAVRPSDRLQNGRLLLERLARLEKSTSIAQSSPREAPTRVATPGAMLDVTAEAPRSLQTERSALTDEEKRDAMGNATTLLQPVHAQPGSASGTVRQVDPAQSADLPSEPAAERVFPRAEAPARSAEPRGSSGFFWSAAILVALGAGATVAYLRFGDREIKDARGRTPGRSTFAPLPSGGAHAPARPQDAAKAFVLPDECRNNENLCACCPSGHDCGEGGCDTALDPYLGWHLRVADVVFSETKPDGLDELEVCITTKAKGERCARIDEGPDGKPAYLGYLSTSAFSESKLDIKVHDPGYSPVPIALGSFRGALEQIVLCRGLKVEMTEGLVEKVVFYLDAERVDAPPCRK